MTSEICHQKNLKTLTLNFILSQTWIESLTFMRKWNTPFWFNFMDAPLSEEEQKRLLNIIYANQEVFSLSGEDLGFCKHLHHIIAAITDKPVYLPHRVIPRQFQNKEHEHLDKWLRQGIIRSSNLSYASQMVTVRKKTGKIRLLIDYLKLKSIIEWDAFSFPHMKYYKQFTTVNGLHLLTWDRLTSRCQLKKDMPKTAFRARSSRLFEFIQMLLGVSNSGSSFCHLVEMCLSTNILLHYYYTWMIPASFSLA